MDDHHRSLLARREIVGAYIKALEQPEKLLRVCADVSGDDDAARSAVAAAFGVSDAAARAILDLQVRRFTPFSIQWMKAELADCERELSKIEA